MIRKCLSQFEKYEILMYAGVKLVNIIRYLFIVYCSHSMGHSSHSPEIRMHFAIH